MKKIYTLLTMAMMALAFTSCDSDESIAYTLEGTWKGNMQISSYWDGRYYEVAYTEITFLKDPYHYSSGTGYWVDYYDASYRAPWGSYVANHINWTVDYGVIRVHFVEDGDVIEIRNYRLDYDRFIGTIYDGDNTVNFELYNTSRPYYNDYRWGNSYWYDDYYWARTRSGEDGAAKKEAPRRVVTPTQATD